MSGRFNHLAVLLPLSLLLSTGVTAQQPQTSNPVNGANSTYVQGIGPGYWPAAGAGLVLNVSPGTTYCGAPQGTVAYAGGSLTLTASQTNYVYLDPSASCAPAFNTTGFSFGQVPLAAVVTGSSAITSITDARGWFVPQPVGTDASGKAVTKYLNSIRFPDQFPGVTVTNKLDAAVADIGAGPGTIFNTTALGAGEVTTLPNNVAVLDFRQSEDIVPYEANPASNPTRPPVMRLEQQMGDFSGFGLTGTLTFNSGGPPYTVTGTGTKFTTELNTGTHFAPTIKLASDASTCWDTVTSVTDDTNLRLANAYACTLNSGGAGQLLVGQQGFGINAVISGGTPNTQAAGEYVALPVVIERTGGYRGIYGANYNLTYTTPTSNTEGQVYGNEIDINNNISDDSNTNNSFGLVVISGGAKKPGTGIFVASTGPAGSWQRGIFDSSYSLTGLLLQGIGTATDLQIIPGASDTNFAFDLRNAGNTLDVGYISHVGVEYMPSFEGTGTVARQSAGSQFHAYSSSNSIQIPMRIENDNGLSGAAALGLGVANSGTETSSFKAGIGLTRNMSNGRGNLVLYNRIVNDANNFAAGDAVITADSSGGLSLAAQGTNQNLTLTASGTGVISAASFITLHSLTVGNLPTAAAGNAGQMGRVSDSTAVSAEGQTCAGGSSHTALAFSDGTKWKCF